MNRHCQTLLVIAGIFGSSALVLASIGAHGAQQRLLANNLLDTFEKAVDYSFYNAITLIGIAVLCQLYTHFNNKIGFHWAGYAIALGGFVFQGSLFLYTLAQIKWITQITPAGGMLMIAGWLLLSIAALTATRK